MKKRTTLLVVAAGAGYASDVARRALRRGLVNDVIYADETPESFDAAMRTVNPNDNLIIAKGMCETAPFMRLVIGYDDKALIKGGADGFLSHCFIVEKRRFPFFWLKKRVIITDAAVNIAPTKEQKVKIIAHAADLARRALGIRRPTVSILTASGRMNPKILSSVDGGWLIDNGNVANADLRLDQLDTAISPRARRLKKLAGEAAHIILAHDLDSGNSLFKAYVLCGGFSAAGLVMGGAVPVVLNSRSDGARSKLLSIKYAKKLLDENNR
ncbi:MAG: hypothetical protein LBQ49_03245 [Rickettsiales bacterium]|jgi:hypothetical protein|nr:hypothetical protein [Rickettsiales bacterium]